jgi:hypothetical protein
LKLIMMIILKKNDIAFPKLVRYIYFSYLLPLASCLLPLA